MSLRTGAPNALNVFSNKVSPPIHYLEIFLNRLYSIRKTFQVYLEYFRYYSPIINEKDNY